MVLPRVKEVRRSYGFNEVAIVPGAVTINPDQVETSLTIGPHSFTIPIIASAMDAIGSPEFAIAMGELGGLSVLNLEGIWTRYENAREILEEITTVPQAEVTRFLQNLYTTPIDEQLVAKRITDIKSGGVTCAVAVTPQNAKTISAIAVEAGADILVVQATVTTAQHISKSYDGLSFSSLLEKVNVPVIVGNCVTYQAALELMETGIHGVLVGVGPGAACTTRDVVGIGVPQVTASMDCAAAREEYFRRSGRYVSVIADGGIRTGGDLCKAIVAGADAVMLGTPFAQTTEAPGKGYNWGMATPDPALPRGTRIKVGSRGPLAQVLFGPSDLTDGTMNFVGALRACMGMTGANTIRALQEAELVYAPDIKLEGKTFQLSQST